MDGGGGIDSGDGDGWWYGEALGFRGESGDGDGPTVVALRGTQIAPAGLSKTKEKDIVRRILMFLFSIGGRFSFAPVN